jgi:hypothetical protein
MKRLLPLTQTQRAELVRRFKTEKNVHLRDRIHCVQLKADGRTNREAAAILLTLEHTVNDWLDRYDKGGLETLCVWDVGGSGCHLAAIWLPSDKGAGRTPPGGTRHAWLPDRQTDLCLGRGAILECHLFRARNAGTPQTAGLQSPEGTFGSRAGQPASAGRFFKTGRFLKSSMGKPKQNALKPSKFCLPTRFTFCTMCNPAAYGRDADSVQRCVPIPVALVTRSLSLQCSGRVFGSERPLCGCGNGWHGQCADGLRVD